MAFLDYSFNYSFIDWTFDFGLMGLKSKCRQGTGERLCSLAFAGSEKPLLSRVPTPFFPAPACCCLERISTLRNIVMTFAPPDNPG